MLRAAWLTVGITLLALAVLEGVARVAWAARAEPPDRRIGADSYPPEPWVAQMFAENRACSHVRWESYVYWRRTACSGKYVNVDEAGLRRTWSAPAQPGRRPLRIFFFGGSATWGTGVRDEHTIPSELAQYLAKAGIYAEVRNFGETGYVTTQDVITLLRQLQRGERPDLAILYIGGTDTFSALTEGGVALPLNESHRRREFDILRHGKRLAAAALEALATHSALGRWIAAYSRRPAAPQRAAAVVPPGAEEDLLRSLAANVQLVRVLAKSYGFEAAFFWEPSLDGKSLRTAYEERCTAELLVPRAAVLDVAGRVRRAWAAPGNRDLTFLGDIFAATREPRFIDGGHTSETANRELAAAIGRQLSQDNRLLAAAAGAAGHP
jgi:lysophospholipase L1-like esterase